jgi:hypothetical protein
MKTFWRNAVAALVVLVASVTGCRGASNPILGTWNLVQGDRCYYDKLVFTSTDINQFSQGKTGGPVGVTYNTETKGKVWVITAGWGSGGSLFEFVAEDRISITRAYGPCVYQKAK